MNKIILSVLLISLMFLSPVSALSFSEAFNNIIKNPLSKLFSGTTENTEETFSEEITGEVIQDITGEAIKEESTKCFIGGGFVYSGCSYQNSWVLNNKQINQFTIYATGTSQITFTKATVETTDQGIKTFTFSKKIGNSVEHIVSFGTTYIVKKITLEVANEGTMVNAGVKYEDSGVPTISITSPSDGQVLIESTLKVEGTADDDKGISKVEVQTSQNKWNSGWSAATYNPATKKWVKYGVIYEGQGAASTKIAARVTDTDGNVNEKTITVSYTTKAVTCKAGSEYSAGYPCTNTFDKNRDTDWASQYNKDPWIELNFVEPQNVNYFSIMDRKETQDWTKKVKVSYYSGKALLGNFELNLANNGVPAEKYLDSVVTITKIKVELTDYTGPNNGLSEIVWGYTTSAPTTPTPTAEVLGSGCIVKEKFVSSKKPDSIKEIAVPIGTIIKLTSTVLGYCDYDKENLRYIAVSQKVNGQDCKNAYECKSNICFADKCADSITFPTTSLPCNGCMNNNKCLPVGFRKANQYCPETGGTLTNQLNKDIACTNNFECKSNLCSDSKCKDIAEYEASLGLIESIWCKINPAAPEC